MNRPFVAESKIVPAALGSIAENPFLPRPWLRQGHVQTLLSRLKPRQLASTAEQPILIDGGPDYCDQAAMALGKRNVQLLGYFTPHAIPTAERIQTVDENHAQGLALLLHGWEGCSHSNYNLALTGALTNAGFDVLRLNLRDHGSGSHLNPYALNPGLFLGVLIDETAAATRQIAQLAGDRPFYIIGASMGGNFALRLAAWHSHSPFPNLRKVIAINPAVDPAKSTDNLDANPVYRQYFRKRWLRSLMAKAALYPHLYQFADIVEIPTIRAMTAHVLKHYGHRFVGFPSIPVADQPFADTDAYFAAYTVSAHTLQGLTVETEIISALDDPIIHAEELYDLLPNPMLSLQIHPTGGHVGYVDLFPVEHRLPRLVLQSLLSATPELGDRNVSPSSPTSEMC